MNDALHYSFDIHCPESLLWWIICIAFIGALITGIMMLQVARFTLTRAGAPVSQQRFHRVTGAGKTSAILGSMNSNARRSLRSGVKIDYAYMPFFYGLLISLSIIVHRNAGMGNAWDDVLHILCWLPIATWLFDLAEDTSMLSILGTFEKNQEVTGVTTVIMAISSWLRWITGIVWLVIMISLGIAWAIEHWG